MKTVITYFDYASPWSYLGVSQIEGFCGGAGARVEWRPILLGGLFKAIGTPNVPLFEMSTARRAYQARDLAHWADHWGVPFGWPSRFPMNTVAALRMTLAASCPSALIQAFYRAYWVEDRDLADRAVLVEVARAAGFDGEALHAATADPAIKQKLIDHTKEAETAGVFGVPTFRVGDELWFGQDRLELLERALR